VLRAKGLFVDRQGALIKGLGLRVLAMGVNVKPRQVFETRGHVGVFRAKGFFPDPKRPLIKGLGVGITTMLVQVDASLTEQSRTLGKFKVQLVDKFRAGARLGKKPFAASPVRKRYVWKCAVYRPYNAFRPQAFRGPVHRLLQHGPDTATVDNPKSVQAFLMRADLDGFTLRVEAERD
jgi:hypothetical protein